MLNLIINCKNILQHIPELHDVLGQCNNRNLVNFREVSIYEPLTILKILQLITFIYFI